MSNQSQTKTRRAPGILRVLPETLPFYPYGRTNSKPLLRLNKKAKKQKDIDAELNDGSDIIIANKPLPFDDIDYGFTLFFFVDSTNRQSLSAIPKVSQWFYYAMNDDGDGSDDGYYNNNSRVICIPNNSCPNEINLSNTTSDPIMQANINSSLTSSVSKQQQGMDMLQKSGFYHLPFLHPKRLTLLHLLGANRVPSIIVVSNKTGRIITRYGWEAIEREVCKLDQYIESNWIENKKDIDEDPISNHFESMVVQDWGDGKSGLPLWWTLFGWIM